MNNNYFPGFQSNAAGICKLTIETQGVKYVQR